MTGAWTSMSRLIVLGAIALAGCQIDSREQVLMVTKSQVALRSVQSRVFDTADRIATLQTVVATMQDLNFVIHDSSLVLGTVSGTKSSGFQPVRMTVTVRPHGEKQVLVRANAQQGLVSIDDPKPYQDFFSALSKAMFLTAQEAD